MPPEPFARERYALGIDVGGTFTDLALIRLSDGLPFYHKTSSSPDDPARSVGRGIEELLAETGIPAKAVGYFGHGTTVATNALIVGRMAPTALVTTAGFEDILEIRRQRQPHNYDIRRPKPRSPIARHLRVGVAERTYLMGDVPSVAPREADLARLVAPLEAETVAAIAVCFLHSYQNPQHETLVADWLRRRFPDAFVCASNEVLAEFREYERMSTTVLNAALGPIMKGYLGRVEGHAATIGLGARPVILQSNGGVASPEEAGNFPVRTLSSGPAAGVMGAIHLATQAGIPDIITFDVGGTSTDVCLIEGGRPLIAREREFAGYPVRFPMIDVHSVGAGGGSIAWVDAGGFLHVGPQSAGAAPGPACYAIGGTEPTVTDANVVLGRLHPEALLGGRMPIRADLARAAIKEKVGDPLGLGVEDAAHAILTILNENLVQAIRVVTVEQGFDPRHFTLMSFGGAGPLLSSLLAQELGIRSVLVPERPGLLCALGLLVADMKTDFSLTRIMPMDRESGPEIRRVFREVEARAADWFRREAVPAKARSLQHAVDMRYRGQSHELTVQIDGKQTRLDDVASLSRAFRAEHARVYGYAPEAPVQVVTYRVAAGARVARPPAEQADTRAGRPRKPVPAGRRSVHFRETGGAVDCPVYDRALLGPGDRVRGPAIIEQMDSTTVVFPGQTAVRDPHGNLLLTFGPSKQASGARRREQVPAS